MPDSEKDKRRKTVEGARSYAKYSGLAIQMVVILLLFVYLGKWLDTNYGGGKPYYTLAASLVGITLALYIPLKSLLKK